MNGGDPKQTIVCEFQIILTSSEEGERILFGEAKERATELRARFQRAVEFRLPRGYRIDEVQLRHGSLIISALLIISGTGNFLLRYKDIRDNLSQLASDLERIVEDSFALRGRFPVRVISSILPGPGFPLPIASLGKATVAFLVMLAIVAMAVFLVEGARETPLRGVTPVNITNQFESTIERIIVVSCGHCKGNGTCAAEKSNESCFTCQKVANVDQNGARRSVICSVCKGRGYHIPEKDLIRTQTPSKQALYKLALVALLGAILLWAMAIIFTGRKFGRYYWVNWR